MLALLRRSAAALFGAVLLAPLSLAATPGNEGDCVHLIGYGGSPTQNAPARRGLGGRLDAGVCAVEDARANRATPTKTGADYVPVSGDDSLGFWCVYGVRASATGGVGGNVGIYLFPLSSGEVLVYGSGYGNIAGANLFDAAYDMERVDQVIRYCMGKTPADTPLRILAPHGHGDHVNPACNRELERLGYRIVEIAFHPGDLSLINGMAWTQADRALFRQLPAATSCLQELTSYASPIGKLWVFERPGHTAGSIDLVVDVRNDPTNRVVVRGSQPSSPCAPLPGQREVINAHGNVELVATPPSLASVAPLSGTALGGTPLTLTGASFLASGAGAHSVLVGGAPATAVVVASDSTLTCVAPPGAPGALVQVAVVNNNGKALYSGTFFYNPLPTLTSLSPDSGDVGGGNLVQVRGSGFLGAGTNEVFFGAKKATGLSVIGDTLLTCLAPSGTSGTVVAVSVRNANGQATLPNAYRYGTGLTVTALAPADGPASGGTTVTITGTAFTGDGVRPVVTFGGVPASNVNRTSDTTLTCVAPAGAAGATVAVVVTNSVGSASFSGYRYHQLPRLLSLSPSIGRGSGGTQVTLSGSGFQLDAPGTNIVRFGGVRATQVQIQNDGQLTCTAPAGAAGTVVNVTVANQNGTATLPLAYTYALPLALQSLSPASGSSGGGTAVTILGSGFVHGPAGTSTVRFGGTLATSVVAVEDGKLTCVAPPGTPLDVVDVTVANSNGSATLAAAFRYHDVPTIAALSPDHGHAGAATAVTITGTGFVEDEAGEPLVVAGGIAASDVEVLSDTTLACTLPPGTPGTSVDILLVNANGSATRAAAFRYHSAPTLASASPASGPAGGQPRITLTGTGFQNDQAGAPTITFGGVPATAVSVTGDQTVRCNAPVGPAGTSVDIVLTNARGSATLAGGYRYHARPRVTAVTPARGTFQGGTAVVVEGAGFQLDSAGTSLVTFGGVLATGVVVESDTRLRCTTPPGALNAVVDVSVSNSNGLGTLPGGFAYSVPAPTIAAVTPSSGRAAEPGTVEITGAGFLAESAGTNVVKFGGVAASAVTVIDDSRLSCAVPPGTPGTSVDVGLSNANGSALRAGGFRYHALPVLASVVPAAGSALGGTPVQLGGSGFLQDSPGPNEVTFGGVAATSVVVVSDSLITCVSPALAPESNALSVEVVVGNANGRTGARGFGYHPRPTLTAVAPSTGPLVGGTSVTLTGSGFLANSAGANRVTFDGQLARSIVVVDDSTIACQTPPNAAGYADVAVTNANGVTLLAAAFHYGKQPPTISSIEPARGRSGGGNLVTLRGRGFQNARTGENRVKFGDALSTDVITVDDETVLCAAPAGAPGSTVDVALNNNLGTATLPLAYLYNDLPTLVSVSPAEGPSLGTGPITLRGTGFANHAPGVTWVQIGSYVASDVVVLDDTRLTCRVTGSPGRDLDVTIHNDNGSATLPGAFTIGGPPRISQVTPNVGPFTGGTRVVVSGAGFAVAGRVDVTFGGVPATSVVVDGDSLLSCVAPAGPVNRAVTVAVRTSYGSARLWNGFTYQSVRPQLSALAPGHGPAAGGTRVTLSGSGFAAQGAGTLRVSFGAAPAGNVVVTSDTSAACDAPAGSAGASVDVHVENDNGAAVLAAAFRYNDPPTLASASPGVGPAAGGARVTLSGTGLADGDPLVLFGGVAALDVEAVSATRVDCTVPAGEPGAQVDVRLLNANGEATLAAAFRYHPAPTLASVSPARGPAAGGTQVTLTGTGFLALEAGTNEVAFGGVPATEVVVVDDTSITCRAPAGAAGTQVALSLSNSNGAASLAAAFRYHALPTLAVVAPNRGPAAGGTQVTLTGTGFLADDAGKNLVFFGNFAATDVVTVSDTQITCRTPVGTAATIVDVSVSNANGGAQKADAYRYNPTPRLVSLSPASGSELGGTTVTLSGANFVVNGAGTNSVTFGATAATGVTVVNDATLSCVAPPGVAGTSVDVRVSNANGSDSLAAAYRYDQAPTLASIEPASGSALGGTTLVLTGAGFTAAGAGATQVLVGGTAASDVLVLDATHVRCTTPPGAAGALQDVVVSNQIGQATLPLAFRRHAAPALASVAPARGSSLAPTPVTLTGSGFLADGAGACTVLFGAVPADSVSVLSDTSISCSVGARPAGTVVDVRVANANGEALLASGFAFDAPGPVLAQVQPAAGSAAGGTSVTLTGSGFLDFAAGTNTVTFGGSAASGVLVVDDATLKCTTPPGTVGTSVDVAVSNANGSATLAAAFTYGAPAPTLTQVSPASGRASGGTTVTLTGTGFLLNGAGANAVTFGGVPATAVTVLSDTSLTCTAPAGPPGTTVAVALSNANGAPELATGYRYHAKPSVTSVSPADGTSLGGTLVTVRGSGFTADGAGTNQVLFGSTPASSVVVFDDARLTCRVPSGPQGTTVTLSVTNANGTAQLLSGFRYHAKPTLTSVTPASGSPLGGARVTLSGSGFLADGANVNVVSFGGVTGTSVQVLGDSTIQCTVPAGTSGISVQVTVANVNGTAILPAGFRYHARPTVTALSPNGGSPAGGTPVTVTGSGFQADSAGTNVVTFGGVAATSVVVASNTQLTCVTPAGAAGATVDVAVSNANGAGTLVGGYTYDSTTVPVLAGTSPARGPFAGSTQVRLSGTGFVPGMTVTFGGAPATSVVRLSERELDCVTPAGVAGEWVDVAIAWPTGSSRLPLAFRYFAPPSVTRLEPPTGAPEGGEIVVVVGDGFREDGAGAAQVTFGGVPALSVSVLDDEHLACEVPAGPALSTVEVAVTNANGLARLPGGFRWQHELATDLDGDGRGDLVLSSPGDDTFARDAGAVDVFFSTALPLSERTSAEADLRALPDRSAALFGVPVASGDVDGDGHAELIVAAPGDDLRTRDAGSVFVFAGPLTGSATPLVPSQARETVYSTRTFDRFGSALLLRDLDRDGRSELVVGAPGRTPGTVYVYRGDAAGLGTTADQLLYGEFGNEEYAASLAAGDLDGDGWPELVVGAPHGFGPGASTWNPGEVRVYRGSATLLTASDPQPWLQFHGLVDEERFGHALAIDDLDGDGFDDLAVGAPDAAGGGRVDVFRGGPAFSGGSAALAHATLTGEAAGDGFGRALCAGDVDGDGRAELLAGAPGYDVAGRAYLFHGAAALAHRAASAADAVLDAEPGTQGEFGSQVALVDVDGNGRDDLVVTAPALDSFGTDLGRVYVFGAATLAATVHAEDSQGTLTGSGAGDQLGRAIGGGR